MSQEIHSNERLLGDLKNLIIESKKFVAVSVNASITQLYWEIGNRINREILKNKRADYGKQIVATLCPLLQNEFGKGWTKSHLYRCMQFANTFTDKQIVATLWRQLSWSHFKLVIPFEDELKREFYIQMCIHEKWSVRTFKERINSMLFERTAISKKPEQTIKKELSQLAHQSEINADLVFKDPYVLDFLELKNTYSEKDLENSILAELQNFIIELGTDFAFMDRQKRITIDSRDYYLDLLFYHRRLKSLVVIELKLGEFEASHKGQMELYLSYLKKYEIVEGENDPIGLILCSGKNQEHIELMSLDKSNIRVAEYLTILPPREVLQQKLKKAISIAQNKLIHKD